MTKEALYYTKIKDTQRVRCQLCPHGCILDTGEVGKCGVRENREGTLVSTNYSLAASVAVDPIEKKPLYHFHPGRDVLSLGAPGCNLTCSFCQNWQLARADASVGASVGRSIAPAEVVEMARSRKNCVGIAYTYSEPMVWYEFVLESARLAEEAGLENVMVTNGFINPRPLAELSAHIQAMNIDLKAFTDDFYTRHCGGRLKPVLRTIVAVASRMHLEVTLLLIPGLNDGREELDALAGWLADIDTSIPLHISRYFPQHKMRRPPSPIAKLEEAREIALEYLEHVYLGNIGAHKSQHTYCPQCGEAMIQRAGLGLEQINLEDGRCPNCKAGADYLVLD